jgi:hypothetical protein
MSAPRGLTSVTASGRWMPDRTSASSLGSVTPAHQAKSAPSTCRHAQVSKYVKPRLGPRRC